MLNDITKIERFKISLPAWFHDDLECWAWVKGTDRARLSANILQARIEANRELINSQLADIAEKHGLTANELRALILDKGDKNENPTN